MADYSVKQIARETWADLDFLLTNTYRPGVEWTGTDFTPEWSLWGRKGLAPMNKTPFRDKGLVMRFKLAEPDNARNVGQTTADSAYPNPNSLPVYTNIRILASHICDFETAVMLEDRMDVFVKEGPEGVADMAVTLMGMANTGLMRKTDLATLSDRWSKVATLAADPGSATDDTVRSVYTLQLSLRCDTIMAGVLAGYSQLQAVAAASFGSAITTLVTRSAPMKVVSIDSIGYTASTVYYKITVAVPYTTTNKTAVNTELTNLTTGQYLVPWADPSDGLTTLPTGGPNYGLCGGPFWWETDGSGAFEDVEDIGGACTVAFTTDQTSPRSVDRNAASKEWAHLNPYVIEGGAADVGTKLAEIQNAVLLMKARNGGNVNIALFAHDLISKRLQAAVGTEGVRLNASALANDQAQKIAAMYGTSAFVWQGTGATGPTTMVETMALPANCVLLVMDPTQPLFQWLSPNSPAWVQRNGGIWRPRYNGAGQELHSQQAFFTWSTQMFPVRPLHKCLAVIRNVNPGT